MKHPIFAFGMIALLAASCTTTKKTASSIKVDSDVNSKNIAELQISPTRVSYSFRPSKAERRGGTQNVINCATAALLQSNGNSDVLIQPEYTINIRTGLFGNKKIREVIMTGYPAKYVNLNR